MQAFSGDQTNSSPTSKASGETFVRARPRRRPRSAPPLPRRARGGAAGGAGRAAGKAGARAHRRAAAPNGSAALRWPRGTPTIAASTTAAGPAALAPGRLTLHAGQGGAARRPETPRTRPTPPSQPPAVPAGGGTRRERSRLRGLPPATRRVYARGRNFLKETGGPNPRLPGAPTRPPGPSPLWGREGAATDLHTTHLLFPWAVTDCKF